MVFFRQLCISYICYTPQSLPLPPPPPRFSHHFVAWLLLWADYMGNLVIEHIFYYLLLPFPFRVTSKALRSNNNILNSPQCSLLEKWLTYAFISLFLFSFVFSVKCTLFSAHTQNLWYKYRQFVCLHQCVGFTSLRKFFWRNKSWSNSHFTKKVWIANRFKLVWRSCPRHHHPPVVIAHHQHQPQKKTSEGGNYKKGNTPE